MKASELLIDQSQALKSLGRSQIVHNTLKQHFVAYSPNDYVCYDC
jgi:hypothetical protein